MRLEHVSVALFWAMDEHLSDMLRELSLIEIGSEDDGDPSPHHRLVELLGEIRARYAGARGRIHDVMRRAAAEGKQTAAVEVTLPIAAAGRIRALLAAFEEADEHSRDGALLTLATEPPLARFRRQLLTEIAEQLEGS